MTRPRRSFVAFLVLFAIVACSTPPPPGPTSATRTVAPSQAASPIPDGAGGTAPPTATAAPILPTPIASVTPVLSPAAPAQLDQRTADGAPVAPGGWVVGSINLIFQAQVTGVDPLVPEVAIASADQPLPNTPSAQGATVTPTGGVVASQLTVQDLPPGQFHWQARYRDAANGSVSPWSPFSSSDADFGLVQTAPTIAGLSISGTHSAPDGSTTIGAADQPVLHWTVTANPTAALDHVVYLADHQAASVAPPSNGSILAADTTTLDLSNLDDGSWNLHLWAVDKAGQVGIPATLPVTVAKQAPQLSNVVFRSWATNPAYQTIPIRFDVSQPVSATLTIMPITTTNVLRTYTASGTQVSVAWDGRDAQGNVVPNGSYRFLINTTDAAGNTAQATYNGLQITDKVIKITLSNETLSAFSGSQLVLKTVVTSGGQRLPTPTGKFEIQEKSAPFVFHSPFPKGSPYWYADVTSHEAMLFDPSGANFIHDAPWRSIFGPGTNGPGIPGSTYDGSHGCVELPVGAMSQLYPWTPFGTPVIITN